MSLSENSTGERREKGRRLHAVKSVGERTDCSFYSMRRCTVKGGCRNIRSWRQRTDATERKMDEGMTATSQTDD